MDVRAEERHYYSTARMRVVKSWVASSTSIGLLHILCVHLCWVTRYATLAPNKIFYCAPKIMQLEIDHGIGFTTRRAVTAAEVELVMRVVDLPAHLLLALSISRE